MALLALNDDALGVIFEGLRNTLDPRVFVDLSGASKGLRALTQALLQQLKADHEAAAALCLKVGLQLLKAGSATPKELREAKKFKCHAGKDYLSADDLGLLGTLGSVLPALEDLSIFKKNILVPPFREGAQRLAEGLGVGALPAVTKLVLWNICVYDAGASALAAALGRGALPQLGRLSLTWASIGDAGLVALAPALRRLPALEELYLQGNPFGDEGLTALVAPPPPAGALPPPTGVLTRLKVLNLNDTQVSDAGCAAYASALDSGTLPALEGFYLNGIPASAAAQVAAYEALATSVADRDLRRLEVHRLQARGAVEAARQLACLERLTDTMAASPQGAARQAAAAANRPPPMRRTTSSPRTDISSAMPSVPEARSISTPAQRPPSFEAAAAVAAVPAPAELRALRELIVSSVRDHGPIVLIAIGAVYFAQYLYPYFGLGS